MNEKSFLDSFDMDVDVNIPAEMFHFIKVMQLGASKYGDGNWLEPNGVKSSERDMHASMGRHWAQSASGILTPVVKDEGTIYIPIDKESKLDPLLHLATRALMTYTRRQRGIHHEDDKL